MGDQTFVLGHGGGSQEQCARGRNSLSKGTERRQAKRTTCGMVGHARIFQRGGPLMQTDKPALDLQAVDGYGCVGVGEGKGASSSRHNHGAQQPGTQAGGGSVTGTGGRTLALGQHVCVRVSVRV